jgi:hypothetical protein
MPSARSLLSRSIIAARRRISGLPQPRQRALSAADADLEQLIQSLALPIGQPVSEPTPQLSLRTGSNRAPESFNGRQWRADDAAHAQLFKHGGHQRGPMIGRECRRQQPCRNFSIHRAGHGAKPKGGLDLKDVLPAGLIPLGVVAELGRINTQLLRDEGAQRSRRLLSLLEDPPWKSQVAEHEGEAQTVAVTATSIDQRQVFGAQRIVAHHLTFIARGRLETDPLRLGEQLSVRHACPL